MKRAGIIFGIFLLALALLAAPAFAADKVEPIWTAQATNTSKAVQTAGYGEAQVTVWAASGSPDGTVSIYNAPPSPAPLVLLATYPTPTTAKTFRGPAGTTGWGVADGWTWYETVGAESGCVTHGTEWGTGPLTQYAVPVTEFIAGHTYRISAVVIGTTIGTFRVHIWGYDDDTYTPVASESFEWEFVAPAYGGETVQVETPITGDFDGSVCSVSIVEVLSPPVSATASRVELTGAFEATSFGLHALHNAPASATDTCTAGEIRWTATHVYLCSATDTWVRAALATWP